MPSCITLSLKRAPLHKENPPAKKPEDFLCRDIAALAAQLVNFVYDALRHVVALV